MNVSSRHSTNTASPQREWMHNLHLQQDVFICAVHEFCFLIPFSFTQSWMISNLATSSQTSQSTSYLQKKYIATILTHKKIYILLPISQRNWAIWRESSHAPPPSYPPARRVSTLGLKTTCSLINPKYSAPPSNPSAWTYTNYLEACLQDPLGLPRDIEINIGVSKKYLLIPVLRKKGYIYPPSSWHPKHSSWPWFLTPLLSFPALLCPPASAFSLAYPPLAYLKIFLLAFALPRMNLHTHYIEASSFSIFTFLKGLALTAMPDS